MTTDIEPDKIATFTKLQGWFRESRDATADWREMAEEDFDFVAGNQWTDEEKQLLQDQLRPIVTFNRIDPVISAVQGTELQNRMDITYSPREMGDVKVNEVITSAADWARDQCDAEFTESDAFADLCICGMGWVEGTMDYMEDSQGKFMENRIDPLEMYWDTTARKKNIHDGRFNFRAKQMPMDEAKDNHPDADEDTLHAAWAGIENDTGTGEKKNPSDSYSSKPSGARETQSRKTVTIIEAQWWEKETYYSLLDPADGQVKEMSKDEFGKASGRYKEMGQDVPKNVKRQRKCYYQAFLGSEVIEMQKIDASEFKYKAMTGKRDRNNNVYYGLVRGMKDPQRWANKWLSQTMHIINSNAKGNVMIETDAVPSVQKFEEGWNNPVKPTWVNPGAIAAGKIKEKQAITYPAGLDRLMEFGISSIRDVSGVSLELLGMAERQQAGVLEKTRKDAGITILAHFFDSLRLMRREMGRLLLFYIQNYMSDGRLVRVVGKQMEQYVPLVRDNTAGEFDVVVDESPVSPNQKEKVFETLMQILPGIMKAGVPVPPSIVEYLPLPSALTDEWSQYIQQMQSQPKPNPEMEKVQGQMQVEQAKLQTHAQIKQQELQMNMEAKKQEMGLNAIAQEQQQKRDAALVMLKANADREAMLLKAEMDNNTKLAVTEMQVKAGLMSDVITARQDAENQKIAMGDAQFDENGDRVAA